MNKVTNDVTFFDIDLRIMGNKIYEMSFLKRLVLFGITLYAIFCLTSEQ